MYIKYVCAMLLLCMMTAPLHAASLIGMGTVQGEKYLTPKISWYPELALGNIHIGAEGDLYTVADQQFHNQFILHHVEYQTKQITIACKGIEGITLSKGLVMSDYRTMYIAHYYSNDTLGTEVNIDLDTVYAQYVTDMHEVHAGMAGVRMGMKAITLSIGGGMVKEQKEYSTQHISLKLIDMIELYKEVAIQKDNSNYDGIIEGIALGTDSMQAYYEHAAYANYFIPKKYDAYYALNPSLYTDVNTQQNGEWYEYGISIIEDYVAAKAYKRQSTYSTYGIHVIVPLSKSFFVEYQYEKPNITIVSSVAEHKDAQFLRSILIPSPKGQVLFEVGKIRSVTEYWQGKIEYMISL